MNHCFEFGLVVVKLFGCDGTQPAVCQEDVKSKQDDGDYDFMSWLFLNFPEISVLGFTPSSHICLFHHIKLVLRVFFPSSL